jgi:hypothetical protein
MNDRGVELSPGSYIEQTRCDTQHSTRLFHLDPEATLKLTDVKFQNMRQQFYSLIDADAAQTVVTLENVDFERCQAGKDDGNLDTKFPFIILISNKLTFNGGSVTYLNDGYEMEENIVLTGFLYGTEAVIDLKFDNVKFEYNYVFYTDSISGKTGFVMISDYSSIEMTNCEINYNYANYSIMTFQWNIKEIEIGEIGVMDDGTRYSVNHEKFSLIMSKIKIQGNKSPAASVIYIPHNNAHMNCLLEEIEFYDNYSRRNFFIHWNNVGHPYGYYKTHNNEEIWIPKIR